MDTQTYALIDIDGGWLVNLVLWNGDTSVWQPPPGAVAVLAEDVDISSLPPSP